MGEVISDSEKGDSDDTNDPQSSQPQLSPVPALSPQIIAKQSPGSVLSESYRYMPIE